MSQDSETTTEEKKGFWSNDDLVGRVIAGWMLILFLVVLTAGVIKLLMWMF